MTHDSIGLGEDGPTHQPIEHLQSLRAMPDLDVYRPCDIIETAECWQLALDRADGPSLLALTRQNLPQLRDGGRSEEHTSELQSLMRISYAVFCLNNKTTYATNK